MAKGGEEAEGVEGGRGGEGAEVGGRSMTNGVGVSGGLTLRFQIHTINQLYVHYGSVKNQS